MPYAQAVAGPPGSGKSTYCLGMHQYLTQLGRPCHIINLDPGNDLVAPEVTFDVCEVVSVPRVMEEAGLGPNGGLVWCIDYMVGHLGDLCDAIKKSIEDKEKKEWKVLHKAHLLLDLPGQVELTTHHSSLPTLLTGLGEALGLRVTLTALTDATSALSPHMYISSSLLTTMQLIKLNLPAISVLSKADLLKGKETDFNLDFYTTPTSMAPLVDMIPQNRFDARNRRLTESLIELVEDYSLVRYIPLDIQDAGSVGQVVAAVDRASGYEYVEAQGEVGGMFKVAARAGEIGDVEVVERWQPGAFEEVMKEGM